MSKETNECISFPEEVWKTLSRIDVTDHIEWLEKTAKRPAIDYLPWHAAWILLKRNFPASTHEYEQDLWHPDNTVEVGVRISIRSTKSLGLENEHTTYCRLAVMDNWMNPIANPTARQINDSRQRCLVKALAFAGLGLDLWSKDGAPVGTLNDPLDDDQLKVITDLIEKSATDEVSFLKWAKAETVADIPQEKYSSARSLLESKIRRMQKEKK